MTGETRDTGGHGMRSHDTDWLSLISGLLFTALGAVFLSDRMGVFDLDVRWIWPALLIGLGVAGLASGRPRQQA